MAFDGKYFVQNLIIQDGVLCVWMTLAWGNIQPKQDLLRRRIHRHPLREQVRLRRQGAAGEEQKEGEESAE